MKTKVFSAAVIFIFISQLSFALEPNCPDWLGTWEIENTDSTTSTLIVNESTEDTGSTVLICQAFGKFKTETCAKPIQIFFISMTGYYSYSEDLEIAMGMDDVEVTLNEIGDAFVAADNETYGFVSGTKISNDIEIPVSWEDCPSDDDGDDNETDDDEDDEDDEDCLASSLLGRSAPQLNTFRCFRDEVLNKSMAGCELVSFYYDQGEAIIAIISKYPVLEKGIKKILESLVLPIAKFLK